MHERLKYMGKVSPCRPRCIRGWIRTPWSWKLRGVHHLGTGLTLSPYPISPYHSAGRRLLRLIFPAVRASEFLTLAKNGQQLTHHADSGISESGRNIKVPFCCSRDSASRPGAQEIQSDAPHLMHAIGVIGPPSTGKSFAHTGTTRRRRGRPDGRSHPSRIVRSTIEPPPWRRR